MSRLTDELMNSAPWASTEERAEWWRNKCYEVFEELEHYRHLEEQGRLIVMPEKLVGHGDPVGEQGVEGKGRWIDNHCSVCGITPLGEEIWTHLDLDPPKFENYMNYCPNCGAKMTR